MQNHLIMMKTSLVSQKLFTIINNSAACITFSASKLNKVKALLRSGDLNHHGNNNKHMVIVME